MTESQVAKLVAVLMVTYPNAKWIAADLKRDTPGTSTAYERMLVDLDYAAANAAIERLIATKPAFPPSIAEIREAALAVSSGERRAGGDAWGDVLAAIRRYGYARTPGRDFELEDPVVLDCIKALGWQELCSSENQVADRARFIELYDKRAADHRRRELSEGLPAMHRLRMLQSSEAPRLTGGGSRSLPAPAENERPSDARPGDGAAMLAELAALTADALGVKP